MRAQSTGDNEDMAQAERLTRHGFGDSGDGFGVWSSRGPRPKMEDMHTAHTNLALATGVEAGEWDGQTLSFFAVYDGHAGIGAAEFAHRTMPRLLSRSKVLLSDPVRAMEEAFQDCDEEFSNKFPAGVRVDGSGTCALSVLVFHEHRRLVVCNLGDCRAVLSCRGVGRQISVEHRPNMVEERERIVAAGGWIQVEHEMVIPRVEQFDLSDQFVLDRLMEMRRESEAELKALADEAPHHRLGYLHATTAPAPTSVAPSETVTPADATPADATPAERHRLLLSAIMRRSVIYRVCGDLGVTRAIGDLELKAPRVATYPFAWPKDHHSRRVEQDLVLARPDAAEIALEDGHDFVILACDGLWEVLRSEQAVELAHKWLYESLLSPQQVARNLVQLAFKLGSSDNVTVMIVMLPTANHYNRGDVGARGSSGSGSGGGDSGSGPERGAGEGAGGGGASAR